MPYKNRRIEVGSICHVLNRGVDKRNIFIQEKDYVRFIHDLFEFNDERPANDLNVFYFFQKYSDATDPSVIARHYIEDTILKRIHENDLWIFWLFV